MSAAVDALDLARRHGVEVELRDDKLHMKAPAAPPAEVVEAIKAAKLAIIAWLSQGDLAERAAIVEYDAKVPRVWAEGFARLNPNRPPADVPARRWLIFIDDCGRFLDQWAGHAAALGWGPLDVFGCDARKPFARIDAAGLLWLLNGDKLVALTSEASVIERRTGGRQTYRRCPTAHGAVLPWQLT